LEAHKKIEKVYYPGLESNEWAREARKNFLSGGAFQNVTSDRYQKTFERAGFGGMVSFLVKGGEAAARKTAGGTKLITLGESLGGVESLIEHPAAMTHASLAGSGVEVDPALVRLSVGLENLDDLLTDLDQALEANDKEK
jgi:cystathionine gamma-synthase